MKKILQITIAFLCFNLASFPDSGLEENKSETGQETKYDFK